MNGKVVGPAELSRILRYLKKKGKKIVTTNGCFDILHRGHVTYLQKAKGLGDVLVVALNSDEAVRKLKGKGRPINDELSRAEVMAALGCVDFVTIFRDDDPKRFVRFVRPDIHVKASDYNISQVIEYPVVKECGGKLVLIKFVEGFSTSGTVKKMGGAKWPPIVLG